MLVHAGKYGTEDESKIQTKHKLINTTQKKQTMQNTAKQNYPGLVAFYDTRPGNEVGLFYNTPEPTWGAAVARCIREMSVYTCYIYAVCLESRDETDRNLWSPTVITKLTFHYWSTSISIHAAFWATTARKLLYMLHIHNELI